MKQAKMAHKYFVWSQLYCDEQHQRPIPEGFIEHNASNETGT